MNNPNELTQSSREETDGRPAGGGWAKRCRDRAVQSHRGAQRGRYHPNNRAVSGADETQQGERFVRCINVSNRRAVHLKIKQCVSTMNTVHLKLIAWQLSLKIK